MNKNVAKVVKHAWGRIVILLGTCSSSIRWDYRHFLRHFNFVFINYFFFMFEKEYTDNKKKERTLDVPIHISISGPRMAVCSSFSHFSLTTTIWLLQITIKIFPRRFNPNEALKNVHWLFYACGAICVTSSFAYGAICVTSFRIWLLPHYLHYKLH